MQIILNKLYKLLTIKMLISIKESFCDVNYFCYNCTLTNNYNYESKT